MSTFDETLGALSALQTGAGLDTLRELLHVIREPRDPSRPASIEEGRLAAGWRREFDAWPLGSFQAGPLPPDGWRPAPDGAGAWALVGVRDGDYPLVMSRWLVPVEAPNG